MNQRTVLRDLRGRRAGRGSLPTTARMQERAQLALHTISPEWLEPGTHQEVLELTRPRCPLMLSGRRRLG